MRDQDFIEYSLKLYDRFNKDQIFYREGEKYDKLVSAEPVIISKDEYSVIEDNGSKILKWLNEQRDFLNIIKDSNEYDWLKSILSADLSEEVFDIQMKINSNISRLPMIVRADLSSFPFACHEAQLRWAALGIQRIPEIFNETIPYSEKELPIKFKHDILESIQIVIDSNLNKDSECAIYLTPEKYRTETFSARESLDKVLQLNPKDFNEQNLSIVNGKLIHNATGKVVKLIFRRQLSLSTLLLSEFGRKIVDLYLAKEINFEPGLNLLYDMKIGMALAFDERTRQYFSDDSRSLFLKTSLFNEDMDSFNSVFGTNYESFRDFSNKTTKSKRRYIFKYGGSNLKMSFGGSHVFRFDKNNIDKLIEDNYEQDKLWIIQELDRTRYKLKYLVGDYDKPSECRVETSDNFSARFKVFYLYDKDTNNYVPVNIAANLVNDHWKARSKTSDHRLGKGTVITGVRLSKE